MAKGHKPAARVVPPHSVQNYLEALADPDSQKRQWKLLTAYAEIQFRRHGGGRCSLCGTHVRHKITVTVQRNGTANSYDCLCTRCLEGERANADAVLLRAGRISVELAPASGKDGERGASAAAHQP